MGFHYQLSAIMIFRPFLPILAAVVFIGISAPLSAQEELFDEQQEAQPSRGASWLEGDYSLGDFGGYRAELEDRGVSFFGGYAVEVWGNTTGGLKRGTVYTGLLDFGVDLDLEKLVGWKGATFHSSWQWLSGRDASEDLVGNIFTISNIAGFDTLRAFDLWFEQAFLDDFFSIRVGQLAADDEFIISDTAGLFLNSTFGWPALASEALPNGGPASPMATLGIRLAIHPTEWFSFLSGAFQGNPFEENVNRQGFRWRLDEKNGFTFINEAQFRWDDAPLPGTVKAGGFANTGFFERSNGSGDEEWGNFGFYGVIDQALYREPGVAVAAPFIRKNGKSTVAPDGKTAKSFKELIIKTKPSNQGLNAFVHAGFTPQDRNFLSFYLDTGLAYTGLIPARDDDVFGVALGYADVSSGAAQGLFDEGSRQVGYEIVIEAAYAAQITPWLTIQPDVQYIIRPGASGDLGNAFVLGGQASVVF
jgi:porin